MKKTILTLCFLTNIILSIEEDQHLHAVNPGYEREELNYQEEFSEDDSIPDNFIENEYSETYNGFRMDSNAIKSTWTEPLIIDDNNPQFKHTTTIRLKENIVFKPSPSYKYPANYSISYPAAIIVAKSNVTIDLSGFTLSLDPSSASNFLTNQPLYGISIYSGVKNVKIISSGGQGTIFGFSGYAIFGLGYPQGSGYDPNGNLIQSLFIDNLILTQNISGIYLNHILQVSINNTNINYNYSPRPSFGIYLENANNGMIENCNVSQNTSYHDITGIYLFDTVNMIVKNCKVNFNAARRDGYATGIHIQGAILAKSVFNTITNCDTSNNLCGLVEGREARGILINGSTQHNIIINNTSFRNSYNTLFPGAVTPSINPIAYGIKVESGSNNQIDNNTCGFNDGYGFSDSLTPSQSFYQSNTALFNLTENYDITILGAIPPATISLPVVLVYPDDITNYNYQTPNLSNVSILKRSLP